MSRSTPRARTAHVNDVHRERAGARKTGTHANTHTRLARDIHNKCGVRVRRSRHAIESLVVARHTIYVCCNDMRPGIRARARVRM